MCRLLLSLVNSFPMRGVNDGWGDGNGELDKAGLIHIGQQPVQLPSICVSHWAHSLSQVELSEIPILSGWSISRLRAVYLFGYASVLSDVVP